MVSIFSKSLMLMASDFCFLFFKAYLVKRFLIILQRQKVFHAGRFDTNKK